MTTAEVVRARRPRQRRAARFVTAATCLLFFIIVMTTCMCDVAAVDVMGAALAEEDEGDAALLTIADSLPLTVNAAAKEGPQIKINARQEAALAAVNKQANHLADVLSKHEEEKMKRQKEKAGVDEDEGPDALAGGEEEEGKESALLLDKPATERPMLGAELSPEQLEAIGLTTSPPLDAETKEAETKKEQVKPKDNTTTNTAKEASLKKDTDDKMTIPNAVTSTAEDEKEELAAAAAANVSIDHVEAHLHILQQLELSVAQSIEKMNTKVNARHAKPSEESMRISQELQVLKVSLPP